MRLSNVVAIGLIVIELVVLVYLINDRTPFFAGYLGAEVATLTPLDGEKITIAKSGDLKYYYEHKPNQVSEHSIWSGYEFTHTINADTLNERFNYPTEKPAKTFRIITLGDSFTFGDGMETKDNWPEQLEDLLNKYKPLNIDNFEVINLGMSGFGVEYVKHRYELRGIKYKPDVIVWLESGSGFNRINELIMENVNKFLKELSPEEIENAEKSGNYALPWTKAYDEVKKTYSDDDLYAMAAKSWEEFYKVRGDTPVILATFVQLPKDDKELLRTWTGGAQDVYFLENVTNVYVPNRVLRDGHPNKSGHAAIAGDIFRYLKDDYLPSLEASGMLDF